jgi:hypothetical protein
MQTLDLEEGEELLLGNVRIAVLEVEGDTALLRVVKGDDVWHVRLEVLVEAD